MASSAAGWIAKVLLEDSDVAKATPLAANFVEVERPLKPSFLLGVTSVNLITNDVVGPFLAGNSRPSFVVNIPREAVWTGGAIAVLQANSIAFGGVSDLRRAVNEDDPRNYVFKEYAYVERRLRQHRKVTGIDRLFDRAWEVKREGFKAISVAISNEYDLTADEVRTAYDRYGPFDILFHTNSIGHITDEAQAAALELGVELISSGELYERLGK